MTANHAIKSARLMIGMEVHVELATRSKMFTRAANLAHPDHFEAAPNTLVDPVVLALPGALPVMNRRAIEMAMMVGLALKCSIAEFSKWDRKNYFYPDLPKGYQISQYDLPLCFDGEMDIPAADNPSGGGELIRVGIIRAHLEEDTGKLGHELPGGHHYDGSLVDYNRAGTPLLEIVTHPDLTSAEDAVTFCKELRNLCRFLGVTEGIMQRGHMRFEPNVNVIIDTDDGREIRTPIVEVKNLNSFKAVKGAIEYEFMRQIEAWKADGIVMGRGAKRTRGWDDVNQVTVLQREKEDAHDYRYFPDPDLVPVVVGQAWRDEVAATIPELPMQRQKRYQQDYGVSLKEALALTDDRDLCLYYESCVEALHARARSQAPTAHPGHAVAKLLLNNLAKRANERRCGINELGLEPQQVAQIIELRDAGQVGSSAVDRLIELLAGTNETALNAATHHGLIQVRDEGQLDEWVAQAIAQQPQAAADFAAGKDVALGRLTGAVMKLSKGQADAAAVQAKLRKQLRGE